MEEAKAKKENYKKRIRDEEAAEEARVLKEREVLDKRFQDENKDKKKKFQDV